MGCSCARLRVGFEVTEARNWNPECPDHGLDSDWYNSPEQRAERQRESDRLRELYARAREARRST